jgi:hypothetical protein
MLVANHAHHLWIVDSLEGMVMTSEGMHIHAPPYPTYIRSPPQHPIGLLTLTDVCRIVTNFQWSTNYHFSCHTLA